MKAHTHRLVLELLVLMLLLLAAAGALGVMVGVLLP